MANPISSVFKRFFSKDSQSVLGIDIGSSAIKIVQLRRKNGRAILETYGELALGPYANKGIGESTNLPIEKIVEALNDMLAEKEVNITTRACGVAISFASSLMSVVELPNVPTKQLEQMIPLEARKYIPVPISEVTLDWSVIPKDKNLELDNRESEEGRPKVDLTEILLVALHNDTLARYKEIVTKTNLEATFFEIELFSTIRSILDQEITPVLLIDMGATTTKLYIVERGILRGSHTINNGSHAITNALSKSLGISMVEAEVLKREKGLLGVANGIGIRDIITTTIDYIFSEANHVLLAYQKKYNKNVGKVVLVGGGSALKGLDEVAKVSFQNNVESGNPFLKVVVPAFLEDILRQTGPEFAVAVGIALRKLQESE